MSRLIIVARESYNLETVNTPSNTVLNAEQLNYIDADQVNARKVARELHARENSRVHLSPVVVCI